MQAWPFLNSLVRLSPYSLEDDRRFKALRPILEDSQNINPKSVLVNGPNISIYIARSQTASDFDGEEVQMATYESTNRSRLTHFEFFGLKVMILLNRT